MKKVLILYPNQLFPAGDLPQVDHIFLVEEPLFFGRDTEQPKQLHKQKLILHRASMRRYVEEVLWPAGYEVDYIDLDVLYDTGDIFSKLKHVEQIYVFDPVDNLLASRLLQARRNNSNSLAVEFLPNPNYYLLDQEIRQYFTDRHKHPFPEFYQWQRERFNILIGEDYKPIGGKWIYEVTPKTIEPSSNLPSFEVFGDNKFVKDAVEYVNKHFPDNPGSTDFIWPTNHNEAKKWLTNFLEERIDHYSEYENSLDGQAAWLFHSALASSLNTGLLSPKQIIDETLARHQKKEIPINSLESFVRQILGWREFVRGSYLLRHNQMKSSNIFKHQRKLTRAWYDGTTGIPPFDDLVVKIIARGYAHNSERQLIAGNLMVLCEIQPDDMLKWFSELFVDSYDWVTIPNVFMVSQFTDSSNFNLEPSICPSTYILQLSNYQRDVWCDIWDGLYWRFINKHRDELNHNARMRTMLQRLDRLDPDRQRIINYRAEDFLNKFTVI